MERRAFVTGATGFIGRLLVDELHANGWTIVALVRESSDTRHLRSVGAHLVRGDLAAGSPDLADAVASADTVFHLAAVTAARRESDYRDANERGTRTLITAVASAHPRPRRLVYLSSYAAAGPALAGKPRDRHATPDPLTAYGRTKLAGERISYEAREWGLEVVVIRAPVVYGPGDRALLQYFRLVKLGVAPAPGGGDRRLHLVFGPDLARALRRSADLPSGTLAVADPVIYAWSDVARTIARTLNRRPLRLAIPTPFVRFAAGVTETVGRISGTAVAFNREKAEEMLAPAWVCDLEGSEILLPQADITHLDEGIDQTVRWYIRQGWL